MTLFFSTSLIFQITQQYAKLVLTNLISFTRLLENVTKTKYILYLKTHIKYLEETDRFVKCEKNLY